jgi:hypothetical protein
MCLASNRLIVHAVDGNPGQGEHVWWWNVSQVPRSASVTDQGAPSGTRTPNPLSLCGGVVRPPAGYS